MHNLLARMPPYYEQDGIAIYHGDCLDVLPTLPACDLVVTDPPYSFGLASTAQETKAGGWGDLMNSATFYTVWLRECRRLTENRQGAAWVFNSWRSFPILARAAYEAAWPITSLLVWDKEWIGPGGPQGLRPSYELAALFSHQNFQIPDRGVPDIWRCKASSFKPWHPAEKPIQLLQRILLTSGGGLVLDPFMGSGSTLVAAKALGCRAMGIEVEEKYCEVAATRLAQGVIPFPVYSRSGHREIEEKRCVTIPDLFPISK